MRFSDGDTPAKRTIRNSVVGLSFQISATERDLSHPLQDSPLLGVYKFYGEKFSIAFGALNFCLWFRLEFEHVVVPDQ